MIAALHHERVRLTGEWSKAFDDEECSVIYRDSELERIASAIDLTTDLRRKIEVADAADNTWPIDPILGHVPSRFDPKVSDQIDITVNGSPKLKYVIRKSISTSLLEDIRQATYASIDRLDAEHDEQVTEPKAAWHHKHGWLHPSKAMEAAEAAVEAGDLTREEVADGLGFDIAEVDAQIASIRDRLDRPEPGSWTTLPEGFDVTFEDADFDAELGDSRASGFVALLFQDFSAANDADVKNALELVRARPSVVQALKGNLDAIVEMANTSAVVS